MRRKYHEREAWEEFCTRHNHTTGGALPTWLNNLGSWAHGLAPQIWEEHGKEIVKKILENAGPIVLAQLGVPPGLSQVVVDYVKGQIDKTSSAPKAVKELAETAKKQEHRKKLLRKKDKSKPVPALKRGLKNLR